MLSPHGFREWFSATVIALAATAALILFQLYWWLIPVWLAWLVVAGFFRDPPRRVPAGLDPGAMLSPADGTITRIEFVDTHEAVIPRTSDGEAASADAPAARAVVIRIFLSVLNVHVNRAPCDGVVERIVPRPGRYLDARSEESARVNESNLIVFRREETGEPIGVRQVSGAIARRIVCPLTIGQRVRRGERIGMIKFGSTTELILPDPGRVEVLVKPGDKVRGARTPLAKLRPAS